MGVHCQIIGRERCILFSTPRASITTFNHYTVLVSSIALVYSSLVNNKITFSNLENSQRTTVYVIHLYIIHERASEHLVVVKRSLYAASGEFWCITRKGCAPMILCYGLESDDERGRKSGRPKRLLIWSRPFDPRCRPQTRISIQEVLIGSGA